VAPGVVALVGTGWTVYTDQWNVAADPLRKRLAPANAILGFLVSLALSVIDVSSSRGVLHDGPGRAARLDGRTLDRARQSCVVAVRRGTGSSDLGLVGPVGSTPPSASAWASQVITRVIARRWKPSTRISCQDDRPGEPVQHGGRSG
jgi:hypothetical protein